MKELANLSIFPLLFILYLIAYDYPYITAGIIFGILVLLVIIVNIYNKNKKEE